MPVSTTGQRPSQGVSARPGVPSNVDDRPRMMSPVERADEENLSASRSALDKTDTEQLYSRVNKRKTKACKQSLTEGGLHSLKAVGQVSTVQYDLITPPHLMKQRGTVLSTGHTQQKSVSAVKNNKHENSSAHGGKLEIVRQGTSFIVESESDPSNDRPQCRSQYEILEPEDYSESDTLSETTNKRQTSTRMQGKVKSEGEISVAPHDLDTDEYDHVTRCQPVDIPVQIGELEDYDHFRSTPYHPLTPTPPGTPNVNASVSPRNEICISSGMQPSPHPAHRQRKTSPGEQTAASFPNTVSFPGETRSRLEQTNNEGPLLLLHMSTTSLASASSVASERLADSLINQQSEKVHEISAQVTALQQVITELQVENESLKQLSTSVQEGNNASAFLRRENALLIEDNKQLKETVHRLAVELSRYQAKHPTMTLHSPKIKAGSKQSVRVSQALFIAYDERLKEKDDILRTYESHLQALKQQIASLSEENRRLAKRIKELNVSQPVSNDEWLKIQSQVQAVLDENAQLVEENEVQNRKVKAQLAAKDKEVKELSEELSMLNGEKTALQDEIETLKQNYRQVKERFERITVESLEKMPIEEHLASIEECQKVTQDVERKCKAEAKNAFARLQAMQREKQSLEAEKAGAAEHVARLQAEVVARKRSEELVVF